MMHLVFAVKDHQPGTLDALPNVFDHLGDLPHALHVHVHFVDATSAQQLLVFRNKRVNQLPVGLAHLVVSNHWDVVGPK